jgi:hypothetical protein
MDIVPQLKVIAPKIAAEIRRDRVVEVIRVFIGLIYSKYVSESLNGGR